MKFVLTILAILTLVGCSQENAQRLPTAPGPSVPSAPTTGSLTFVWAKVVDATGACIVGATVEVVRGQGLGQNITQSTLCDAWSFDGGATFKDLTPGVEMTLRASASGHAAQEKTVVPSLGPQQAILFTFPSAPTATGFSLSGVVFESTSAGRLPVSGGHVNFSLDGGPSGPVPIDATGRYAISNLPPGRLVRVTAFDSGTRGLEQRCPASATIARDGDTKLDIELVRQGSLQLTNRSPTLSGVVFETTPEGPRPVAGTPVFYYVVYYGTWDVYTKTDAHGRYEFCRIPEGAGTLAAGDCNDNMLTLPVTINRDTVVDVDLTSFNASCPR